MENKIQKTKEVKGATERKLVKGLVKGRGKILGSGSGGVKGVVKKKWVRGVLV